MTSQGQTQGLTPGQTQGQTQGQTPGQTQGAGPGPARVALVTGAARGIGRAIADSLARSGVAVGLLGRTREPLQLLAAELRRHGAAVAWAVADVRVHAEVSAAVEVIEGDLGGVDLLVNNAGVIESSEVPVWEADPDEWWSVVETDLRGPFNCVRAAVPGMLERGGGRVIDLNSGAGALDRASYSAYCAAKAGLFRIGGSLHVAGFERGLRSFELSPGVVITDMTRSMAMHDDRSDWTAPEAVTELVLAIASGELDVWSGAYIRAGIDTAESLRAAADQGRARRPARTLGIQPWGEDDPARS